MRERVGALSELHRFDAGLIEQHRAFEDVHRRRVEPRPEIDVLASVGHLPLDDGGGRLARQSSRVHQVVVEENADRAGPFERRERVLDRTTDRIIEGEQPRGLAGASHEVR